MNVFIESGKKYSHLYSGETFPLHSPRGRSVMAAIWVTAFTLLLPYICTGLGERVRNPTLLGIN